MSEIKDALSHSLYHEFPKHHDQINRLKQTDSVFAEKANEYHKLDHQVRGLEDSDVPVTDDVYNDLKQHRAKLKDDLYQMLTANQPP